MIMNNQSNHYSHHIDKKNYLEKKVTHRNSRNILSILFDEVYCSEEKFDILKKQLLSKHQFHFIIHSGNSLDVFNKNT